MRCSAKTTKGTAISKKALLVSKDLGKPCFLKHLSDIVLIAEKEKCQTMMLALHSVDDDDGKIELNYDDVFGSTKLYPKYVILEFGSVEKEITFVEVFSRVRGKLSRRRFVRHFATSTAGRELKMKLVAEFQKRHRHISRSEALVICGESNVIKTMRSDRSCKGSPPIVDEFNFLNLLKETRTEVIWNPWHTWSRRYEVNLKRAALARDGRTVVSVWNSWKGVIRGEAKVPWVAFQNGHNVTNTVRELPQQITSRPDVRVGVLAIG